jgi:hypothetical protein
MRAYIAKMGGFVEFIDCLNRLQAIREREYLAVDLANPPAIYPLLQAPADAIYYFVEEIHT